MRRNEIVTIMISAVTLGVIIALWLNSSAGSAHASQEVEETPARHQDVVAATVAAVDPHLPRYHPSELQPTGTLHVVGSVSTLHLAKPWAEALHAHHPALQVHARSIDATRTPSWWQLTEQSTVAVLTERMTDTEVAAFQDQWGYEPIRQPVALSAVAFIVHPSNPITQHGLSLPVLHAIFAQSPPPGVLPVQTWGDLGLHGIWHRQPITMHGHDVSAPLFVEVRKRVLNEGTFKASVNRHPSSAAVISAVSRDTGAIGYTDLSFTTPQVAVIPLAPGTEQPAMVPTPASLRNRHHYPLRRVVYLYLNRNPQHALDAPRLALLRLIYSDQGQHIAAARGYIPLSATMARQALKNVVTMSQKAP